MTISKYNYQSTAELTSDCRNSQ